MNPQTFEELWNQAIELLPPVSQLDCFYLEYRPWIRDKNKKHRVVFLRLQKSNRPFFDASMTLVTPKPIKVKPFIGPYFLYGYGATPPSALSDFISKWSDYL